MPEQYYQSQYSGPQIDEAVGKVLSGEAGGGGVSDETAIRAENAAKRAEAAIEHAPKIIDDTWWVWDAAANPPGYVNTGVSANGKPGPTGDPGYSPTVSTVGVTDGIEVTITDRDGKKSFVVKNGKDGGPGPTGLTGYGVNLAPALSTTATSCDLLDIHTALDRAPQEGDLILSGNGNLFLVIGPPSGGSVPIQYCYCIAGKDGFSSTVTSKSVDGGTEVVITGAKGPASFTIHDGKDGEDGEPGSQGKPGMGSGLFFTPYEVGDGGMFSPEYDDLDMFYYLEANGGNGYLVDSAGNFFRLDIYNPDEARVHYLCNLAGPQGIPGKSAYQSYLDTGGAMTEAEWLLSLAQGAPPYAATLGEMTDTGKVYLGSDGNLWAHRAGLEYRKTNQYDPSKTEFNVSYSFSSDAKSARDGFILIPVDGIDLVGRTNYNVKISGVTLYNDSARGYGQVVLFDASGNTISEKFMVVGGNNTEKNIAVTFDGENYSMDLMNASADANVANCYLILNISQLVSVSAADCTNLFVEFVPMTTATESYAWSNTGIKYANYVMTDSDANLVADKILERMDVSYVSSDKVLAVGQYTFRYDGPAVADIGVST